MMRGKEKLRFMASKNLWIVKTFCGQNEYFSSKKKAYACLVEEIKNYRDQDVIKEILGGMDIMEYLKKNKGYLTTRRDAAQVMWDYIY